MHSESFSLMIEQIMKGIEGMDDNAIHRWTEDR